MSATSLWLRVFFGGFMEITAMRGVPGLPPPFYGDLTRIGYLSEQDFGWTAAQPAIAAADLRSVRLEEADVLVLGDSFSQGLLWQSVLVRSGRRVKSLTWQQVPGLCAGFAAWARQQGFTGRLIIAQSIERELAGRLRTSRTCSMKEPLVADAESGGEPPRTQKPGFRFNATEALATGVRTIANTWRASHAAGTPVVLGDVVVRSLPEGCKLFSHRVCEHVPLLRKDAQVSPLSDADLEHMLALQAAARPVDLMWLVVPDKTSVYFERNNRFWDRVAGLGLGLDLYAQFIQDKWRIRDLYASNDTHLSSAGFLRLGELVESELARRGIRGGEQR